MSKTHAVHWIDGRREPTCPPDPRYPNGVDLDISKGAAKTCTVRLPYPALRCGQYFIRCLACKGQTALITTAGRSDDPRSVKVPCRETKT